jgi:asparagine synthase (glutamine-hydrolysing)
MGLAESFSSGYPLLASYFDANARKHLMAGQAGYSVVAERIRHKQIPTQADILQRATRMDFNNYLAEDILVKVDRASMLNSLEVRAPLLDVKMIEFAFSKVPSNLKATQGERKILLKRLAQRLLPPEFDLQRKQGFSIPLAVWLKSGPFRDLFWSVLTDPACLFDRRMVKNILKMQDLGLDNGERLFALVQFELWRHEYGVYL